MSVSLLVIIFLVLAILKFSDDFYVHSVFLHSKFNFNFNSIAQGEESTSNTFLLPFLCILFKFIKNGGCLRSPLTQLALVKKCKTACNLKVRKRC